MKVSRVNKDIAIPSRTQKLQPPAMNVRMVKRTTTGKRSLRGKR